MPAIYMQAGRLGLVLPLLVVLVEISLNSPYFAGRLHPSKQTKQASPTNKPGIAISGLRKVEGSSGPTIPADPGNCCLLPFEPNMPTFLLLTNLF
jgi:hypothetical protein